VNRRLACGAYRALVRLLPGVPAHVDHQHVLSLEGLLLPGTLVPAAHKLLLLPVDVVVVDVLHRRGEEHGTTRYFLFFPFHFKQMR